MVEHARVLGGARDDGEGGEAGGEAGAGEADVGVLVFDAFFYHLEDFEELLSERAERGAERRG